MATTYSASKVATTVQSRAGIDITSVIATFEATTQLVINDIIQMVKIPKGAKVIDVKLAVDDLDGGSACVLAVGDGSSAGRFITGSTIGQAGGVASLGSGVTGASAADCLNYEYTAEDTIDVKVTTAPASSGVGTLNLAVIYQMHQ